MRALRLLLPPAAAVLLLAPGARATPTTPEAGRAAPAPWSLKIGMSYLATSGNTALSTLGFDGAFRRDGPLWSIETSGNALSARRGKQRSAETYSLLTRIKRRIKQRLQLAAGLRAERNRFAGVDLRSLADLGLLWTVHESPGWKLSTLTSLSWAREEPRSALPAAQTVGGVLQLAGEGKLHAGAQWSGQLTLFPNFSDPKDLRAQAQLGLLTPLSPRLGLKCGYDLKYDREPVPGFETTDATTTAALVLQLGRE